MLTSPASTAPAAHRFRSKVRLMPLVALIFFSVSGGAYGLEPLFSSSGPGAAMLLLFLTPLVYSVPVALFTSELSSAIPVEGGYYQWCKRAFGEFGGFQIGMLQWLTSLVDMALYPVMFADYLSNIVPSAADGKTDLFTIPGFGPIGSFVVDEHWVIGVVCVVVPLTLLNIRGIKSVGDSSMAFTVLAVAPFVLLAVWGIPQLFTHHVNPVAPFAPAHTSAFSAMGAGLLVVMWNYNGFDSISTVTEEIDEPRRNLPKALFLSIGLIILAYVIPSLGALADGGWSKWQDGDFASIGGSLGGTWLMWAISIGGMFSAWGLYSSLLMSNSRIPFVMAEDGWIPKRFVRTSPKYDTPVMAIVVCSVFYAVFCNDSFSNLLDFDVILTNLTLLMELAALIALRIKEPGLPRPYRIPGGWPGIALMAVPLTAVICWAGWNVVKEGGATLHHTLYAVAFSVVVYFPLRLYRKSRAVAPEAAAAGEATHGSHPQG
ncbi:APC family permease [Streptomyces sp. RB6PN25]|uniref:APC family permease n=1 Tax=Streptomyces humicola TaxID=2953240 RepID=A0ABT1Q7R0_9ACTN|nr:APC family permease [Streptomyces humicola]MCQ4084860.1 APC family permease [Streptomyces humicola]